MHSASPSRQVPPSDWELIDLVRRGDANSFSLLLDRYMTVIRSRAFRYAAAYGADAEDMVQEAMIAFYRAVHGYNPEAGFQFNTYAITAIHNAFFAFLKKHVENERGVSGIGLDEVDPARLAVQVRQDAGGRPAEDVFLDREDSRMRATRIESLLSQLERRVLRLYLDGRTYQQISTILGVSTKAVDNALQRVRRKLRPEL